jgi:glycosyltransferase involved in cell wall biosynthesis
VTRPALGIAIAADKITKETWSGTPLGLARGLEARGASVAAISAEPPRTIAYPLTVASAVARRNRYDASYTAAVSKARTVCVRTRLRRCAPLDGVIQIGCEFELPRSTRFVLLLDMTVVQAHALFPDFRRLSDGTFSAFRRRQAKVLERASACCAGSSWVADSVTTDFGLPREKVHVVGFGRNHLPPLADRDWRAPRFLFVGREWERKNGPSVVRAFERLRRERRDARLEVVGGHPRIEAPGVTGHGPLRLDVADERARLDGLFAAATCFVMPSECEPFGIVYAEAAGAGIPSIATAVGGAADIIGADAGVLVEPGDEEALLDAMRRLSNPDVGREMGERARRRAGLFTWDAVAERVLRALALPGTERELAGFLG